MSSMSSSNDNRQHRTAVHALKNLLLYHSDDDKTHLLSLLHQLSIKTDSIEYNNQNSKSSSASRVNYNNSHIPCEADNLSALYAHYQIDPQVYPPPDLQLYNTIQQSFHPSLSYLQPTTLQSNRFLERRRSNSNNGSHRSRVWRKQQKRLRYKKNRKETNKRQETEKFHYRNTIIVRQISCHDMLDPQAIIEKRLNKKTRSIDSLENNSQKNKTVLSGFNLSPPCVKLNAAPIQSTVKSLLVSSSTANSRFKALTTSVSNTLSKQQECEKKMPNPMSMTGSNVISSRDLSVSSLASTQLLASVYNQTKTNASIINTTTMLGPQIKSKSLIDNTLHLSTTASSIVPHFSSTIAPYVPVDVLSSRTAVAPNVSKTESTIPTTTTGENIQMLVDQLKSCIGTLSLLLRNKIEPEKYTIPNRKSCADEKRRKSKKKQSRSLSSSLESTPDRSKSSKNLIHNKNDLVSEDITVRRCTSIINQERKKHQNIMPDSYNDQHEELRRCLLVYYRDPMNKVEEKRIQDQNISIKERHRYLSCTWNHLAANRHSRSSQYSQPMPKNDIDNLSMSKSTLVLAEEDDEYELLDELLTSVMSWK